MSSKRGRTYKLFRETKTKAINTLAIIILAVSSLSGALPLILTQKAVAAPGIIYNTGGFSSLTWSPDRTTPSGGYTVAGNSLTLSIDNTQASDQPGFYRTEGVQAAVPAGTRTLKASLYLDPSWATIPVRAGLWGVTSNGSDNGWPIIEYAHDISGYTGLRVYNTSTGVWSPVSNPALGATVTLEIALNSASHNYDFYVNGNFVSNSYSTDGYDTLTAVIFNSFNSTLTAAENYNVAWSNLALGANPTVAACTTTNTVATTALSTWDRSETRATGHNQLTANGLHIWTEGSTSTDKAAGYYPANFPLSALGNQTIAQSIDYQATAGTTPGLQLAVDFDGNGTFDGYLVGEATYGNNWWLSNGSPQFVKDGAPHTGGGNGSNWFGTPNDWLSSFPNATVKAIGYSLGSGVHGDGILKRITLGCTDYTFTLATPTNLTPVDGTYTNDPAFVDTWTVVDGAAGYQYRTAYSVATINSPIYEDSTVTQPGRYNTNGTTVTRQNGGTPEATYYWQVRAIDSFGQPGPWSSIPGVTVDTTKPTTPTNGQPRGGAYKLTNDFYFTWNASSDASPIKYEFQSSGSNSVDSNGSLIGSWNSIANGNAEQNNLTTPQIHSTGAPDGHYYWQVRAIDAADNKSAWSTVWDMNIDSQAPAAPVLVSPADNTFTKGASITQTWSDASTDVASYVYESYNDAGATSLRWHEQFPGTTTSKTATNVANGTYWWRVKAIDAAGNESSWSPLWKITVDNTAPTASIAFPVPGPTAKSFTVTFSEDVKATEAENASNYFLSNWPGADSPSLVGNVTITYQASTHTATITFTNPDWYVSAEQKWGVQGIHDLAGNSILTTAAYSSTMVNPGAPGAPTATSPSTTKTVTWAWTAATDPGGANASGVKGYYYTLTQGPTTIIPLTFTSSLSATTVVPTDGDYTLHVYAVDNAGNTGTTVAGDVTVDSTAPVVTIDSYTGTDTTPALTGSVDDQDAAVTVAIDGGSVQTATNNGDGTWTFTVSSALAVGGHTVVVKATDLAGNSGQANATITVANTPTVTTFSAPANTATPQNPQTPQPVTVTVTPIDDGQVLGDSTASPSTGSGSKSDVKGDTTVKVENAASTEKTSNAFLGLGWWWLLIVALLVAFGTYLANRKSTNKN